jgi:hypothetical protein
VAFKDGLGGDVKLKSATWTTTGPIVASPDDKDPTGAKLFASGPGPATITVVGTNEDGSSATATTEVIVVSKDVPVEGKIDISVSPAPAKKEPAKPVEPPPHKTA